MYFYIKRYLVRPWAAKKGIQLMQEAWKHSHHLKDKDFIRLKDSIEKCVKHVVGTARNSSNIERNLKKNISTANFKDSPHLFENSSHSNSESLLLHSILSRSNTQLSLANKKFNKNVPPKERFNKSCEDADTARENDLRQKRHIGKILDQQRIQHVITATEVSFRWQLGLLVGK